MWTIVSFGNMQEDQVSWQSVTVTKFKTSLRFHWKCLNLLTTSVEDTEPPTFLTGSLKSPRPGKLLLEIGCFLFSFSDSARWSLEICSFVFVILQCLVFLSSFKKIILGRGFISFGLKCLHPPCVCEVIFQMLLWKGGTCMKINVSASLLLYHLLILRQDNVTVQGLVQGVEVFLSS